MERRLHIRSGSGPFWLILSLVTVPAAFAEGPNELDEVQVSKAQAATMAVETANYWTPERMANAKPMTAVFNEADPEAYGDGLDEPQEASDGEEVLPGYAPGSTSTSSTLWSPSASTSDFLIPRILR
jgi:hypothetical protein